MDFEYDNYCQVRSALNTICAVGSVHPHLVHIRIPSIKYHTACIWFWIPKREAISTDTSFEIKMMVNIYAIEIIFKSHEPFQSYLLTGQAYSAKKAG